MGHPGYGPGDLCPALVPAGVSVPAQPPAVAGRLARPDSSSDSQCATCAGIGHQRHAPPYVPLATRTLGGIADLYFCTENEILGRYCRHWNGAVLAGPKHHLKTVFRRFPLFGKQRLSISYN